MKKIVSVLIALSPAVAFAQTPAPVNNINDVTAKIIGIGNTVTYLLVALAVIFIIWNVVMYLIKGSGEEGRTKAGLNIVWGIVGLFVIVSIWGLVNILVNTFKTTPTNQAIPNLGNVTIGGGIPSNQGPIVP